ncbi:MAG: 5-(carboxyamino)imidazole ribonucleotide mutase [Brevinematales bacterium]
MENKIVSILMGSDSDWPIMKAAAEILDHFGIKYDVEVLSAHRAPELLFKFAKEAHTKGIEVIIAGAGGAAHLPGVIAALSPLPVIGVPIKSSISVEGLDSIFSILQMPSGIPVATMALNGAKNAGIFAAQVLSVKYAEIRDKIIDYKKKLEAEVIEKSKELKKNI